MAPKRSADDQLRAAFEAQAVLLVDALAAADPQAPTRCAGWQVGHLDRHLGALVQSLATAAATPAPTRGPVTGTPLSWAQALPGLADVIDETARTHGPTLADALPVFRTALATADPDTMITQRTGTHPLRDALLFRVIELVAHGRDLPAPRAPDKQALKLTVKALAQILAAKAPGQHVEARIPPYSAVQCIAGPRHTRGTPPNVVECEPVAFVELCTGRLSWTDATRDGRVRTWGDRADLSPWLPLLS